MTSQFSADDERVGHRRMLDAIRAEQIKNEPEPDHTIYWNEYFAFGDARAVGRHYCCEWHRLANKGATP